jgi:acetoin utilization protein AcuB
MAGILEVGLVCLQLIASAGGRRRLPRRQPMLVEQIMQSTLVTVTPETTLAEARRLTRQRGLRHLLVVEHDRLVGIVSDRDLRGATGDPAVSEIMTRAVLTVVPNTPVEEAGRLMVHEKISALPVMLGDRLVGVVTETDVL